MNQHSSDNVEKSQKKKLIILIVGIVVLALALGTVGTLWYMKQTERTKAARKQCEIKVAQVSKANAVWKSLVHNNVITDLTKGDSDNAKELAKIMSEKVPDAVSCTANSPEELGSQSAEALAASEWYAVKAKRVRELAVTLIDKNNKKDKDKDKDKDKQDEETKKQEINESTGIVIQRSNVVPPKPKPTPAPTTNTQDTKKQKTEEKPGKNSNTENPQCKKEDKNCTKSGEENSKGEGKGSTKSDEKGSKNGAGAEKPKGNDGQKDPDGKAKKGEQDSSDKKPAPDIIAGSQQP